MFSAKYLELERALNGLREKFIQPHLDLSSGTSPEIYDLDVRAYCVLSHAAFEQYVEDVCQILTIDAVDAWINNHCLSYPLLGLIAFWKDRLVTEIDESEKEVIFYDHIRIAANEAKRDFSGYLRARNHGVSVKYLRQMLLSLGLTVPDDPRWTGSLEQLANQRGDHAHKYQVKKVPSPEDANVWVKDCLEMCASICSEAKGASYRPTFRADDRSFVI